MNYKVFLMEKPFPVVCSVSEDHRSSLQKILHFPLRAAHVRRSFIIVPSAGKNYRQEVSAHYFWPSPAILSGGGLCVVCATSLCSVPSFCSSPQRSRGRSWHQRVTETPDINGQEPVELGDCKMNSKKIFSLF